jgi:toxin FitB
MYILDTNTVSELRKVAMRRADKNVAAWAASVEIEDQYLSAISIQELEIGILLAERKDPFKGAVLRQWMTRQVLHHFRDRILAIDSAVALRSAHLHIQRTRPISDALIAATAFVHGLSVVTRNVRDFHDTGVNVIDPWLAQ